MAETYTIFPEKPELLNNLDPLQSEDYIKELS